MRTSLTNHLFFVRVEGESYSSHRNPQGIYKIEVTPGKNTLHNACAALEVAKDTIPFLDENYHSHTLRIFTQCGSEVIIPRILSTDDDQKGCYLGRSKDHPDSVAF